LCACLSSKEYNATCKALTEIKKQKSHIAKELKGAIEQASTDTQNDWSIKSIQILMSYHFSPHELLTLEAPNPLLVPMH